ncbi:MAG: YceK/YidQ family lipoprotein [Planctomycetaceae bacterium]
MIVAALSVLACGCGTILNFTDLPTKDHRVIPAPQKIYGGVEVDAIGGWGLMQTGIEAGFQYGPVYTLGAIYVWAVDLPLSAVADTLTLPITVPATIERDINRHYGINESGDPEANQNERIAERPSPPEQHAD